MNYQIIWILLLFAVISAEPILTSQNRATGSLTPAARQHVRRARDLGLDSYSNLGYEEHRLHCGGVFKLSTENLQQVFRSPNYLIPSSLTECTWLFIAPVGHTLSMRFTRLDFILATNCSTEYIEVKDGGTSASPLISTICSNNAGKITSTANLLHVKFHWEAGRPAIIFESAVRVVKDECQQVLRAKQGSITAWLDPSTSPNTTCTWTIIVAKNKRINFAFHELDLPESPNCEQGNRVEIIEKSPENITSTVLATFCGSNKPKVIRTSCNKATVKFISNSQGIGQFRGFKLNYTTIDEPCSVQCGGVYRSETGIINSPNFPDGYGPNLNCQWEVIVPPEKAIKFDLLSAMIGNSHACREDYLEINEVVSGKNSTSLHYCSNPVQLTLLGSRAKVSFRSNQQKQNAGFLLLYAAVDKPAVNVPEGPICYKEIRSPTGEITFLDDNPLTTDCVYKIIQPPGTIIQLNVTELHNIDQLEIFNGDEVNTGENVLGAIGRLNEGSMLPRWYNSTINFMTLKFSSDKNHRSGVFRATYKTIDLSCGGLLDGINGTIISPEVLNQYSPVVKCVWIIKVPANSKVTFSPKEIDLFSPDMLVVGEMKERNHRSLLQVYFESNKHEFHAFTSDSRIVQMEFTTDSRFPKSRFWFEYAIGPLLYPTPWQWPPL